MAKSNIILFQSNLWKKCGFNSFSDETVMDVTSFRRNFNL